MATTFVTESKGPVAASDSDAQEDAAEQVDGGIRAWTVVIGAWCCLFCAFGWVNGKTEFCIIPCLMPTGANLRRLSPPLAIGIFQDYYQSNQLHSYSSSSISWILSLEPFVLFAAGLVIGRVNQPRQLRSGCEC
jgi:hypothetical protein